MEKVRMPGVEDYNDAILAFDEYQNEHGKDDVNIVDFIKGYVGFDHYINYIDSISAQHVDADKKFFLWFQNTATLFDYELKYYGRILKGTPMVLIYGEDGSLNYNYQCQETGDIIFTNHGDEESVDYRVLSPRANGLSIKESPFKVVKRGTLEWIAFMRAMEFMEKEFDGKYITVTYSKCRFKLKRWHRIVYASYVCWVHLRTAFFKIFGKKGKRRA